MKINVITLFPQVVDTFLSYSIIGRAREKKLVEVKFINPRDFTTDKHKTVDDAPYGGGSGMVLMAEPFYKALKKAGKSYKILLTPRGKLFNQQKAIEISKKKNITLLCAHYEGIDERITKFIDEEISIGDYILTGGEPAAICVIDAVVRLIKGVINCDSLKSESFNDYLLEYPHYTRPAVWRKMKVPDVLLSGNHKEIENWRKEQSLKITKEKRPDLFKKYLEVVKKNKCSNTD